MRHTTPRQLVNLLDSMQSGDTQWSDVVSSTLEALHSASSMVDDIKGFAGVWLEYETQARARGRGRLAAHVAVRTFALTWAMSPCYRVWYATHACAVRPQVVEDEDSYSLSAAADAIAQLERDGLVMRKRGMCRRARACSWCCGGGRQPPPAAAGFCRRSARVPAAAAGARAR